MEQNTATVEQKDIFPATSLLASTMQQESGV
jgi:hypothetical protein